MRTRPADEILAGISRFCQRTCNADRWRFCIGRLRDVVNNAPDIAERAAAKMERDAELAGRTGDLLRPDIQNARRIIAENPTRWVDALRAAMARGEVLPAVALPILAGAAGLVLQAEQQAEQHASETPSR